MVEERDRTPGVDTNDSMGKLTAKILRSKTKKKVPLGLISPNEPVYDGARRKQQRASIAGPGEGKENTPVRGSRQRTHNDEDDEQQMENSRSSKENQQQRLTRQKRGRTTTDPSSLSGLRGEDRKGEESVVARSQTSTPVRVRKEEEGFLPESSKTVKNLQVSSTGTVSAGSPSEDGKQSEALVARAVEHEPECPECYDERISSGKRRAPAKTCTRRASREGITPSVSNPPEQDQPSGRDQDDIKLANFSKSSDELQETTACATEKMRTSGSSNESQQTLTRRKRFRSPESGSRGAHSVTGSQPNVPIRVHTEEGFLLNDNKLVENVQIPGVADACSPSEGGIERGAPVGTAVERSECPDKLRPVACPSFEQNMGSAELAAMAGSKNPVVLTTQSSAEEFERQSEERRSSGEQRAQTKTYKRRSSGEERAQTKTYRRRASTQGITTCVPNFPEQQSKRNQNGIKSADYCRSDELQATVASATDTLQDAYNKLFRKYQNLKTRQLAEAAEAFNEQSRRIEVFSTAADDLVQNLRTTNSVWDHQEEIMNRSRTMEAAYIECQNDLVIERARNLELRQHLENAELRGSKLLYDLLEETTQLTISNYGKSEVRFSHDQSGYEFKLEQNKLSEEVGGKNALLYNVVSPGTILHVAPEWMQSEIVFDMAQALVFFRRLAIALRRGASV